MAIWSRLTSFIAGGAVARAGSDAVTPVLEPVRQHAWQKNQLRVLDPNTAARLVAQGAWDLAEATDEASRSGYESGRLANLVYLSLEAVGVAQALTLYRRKLISKSELEHAYAKAQIESRYWDGLTATANVLLTPAEIGNAIQQGHLANQGVLPDVASRVPEPADFQQAQPIDGQPPSAIPLTQIDLDGVAQAAGTGTDFEQLQVIANLSGLPPGPQELLTLWNRGLIDEESVDAGIREGHMKTKWLQAFKRLRYAVLSPQDAASARLRTWLTAEESYEIGRQHGYTKEQMDLLFLNRGRPASPTQMWTAWARKVTGPRGVPVEYEDHAKAIAISDIRPEYAEMLWGIRFAYPSLFQLGRLVQVAAIDPDTAVLWASYNRYGPDVTDKLKVYWQSIYPGSSGATGTKPDANLTKAHTQLWSATHKSYVAREIGASQAQANLTAIGIPAAVQTEILAAWDAERTMIHAQLTPAQLVKAVGGGVINPATGAKWTVPEGIAALLDRGYSQADAETLIHT
jgi:hypothetical protein